MKLIASFALLCLCFIKPGIAKVEKDKVQTSIAQSYGNEVDWLIKAQVAQEKNSHRDAITILHRYYLRMI